MDAKTQRLGLSARTLGTIFGILSAMMVSGYVLVNRYVYTQYQVGAFDYTVTFAVAGAVFAALGLVAGWMRRGGFSLPGRGHAPLLLVGLLGALAMGLIVFGQRYTTAVNAGILITATIITTAIYSKYLLHEVFRQEQKLWLAVMFAGIYLGVVGLHLLRFNPGDLIILAASLVFGFMNAYSKLVLKKFEANFVADVRIVISGICLAIIGLAVAGAGVLVTSAGLWPLVAGLFFWLAIRFFYAAVRYVSVNKAFVLNNSQLVFTSLAGVVLLSEPYSPIKFVGSVMVLTSIYFINRG